jgi:hypothetical protein
MAYTPREIKDRVAVGDDIFIIEDLGDDRIRLVPAPTHVSEPGTPVNKALLQPIEDELGNLSATKVDKVSGKGLSTNDFTNALKNKLDGIEAGAQVNTVTSVAGKTGAVTLSKSDVGLGSVQNYGIATQAQAEAGTANNVYMTPLRVKEAIGTLGCPLMNVIGGDNVSIDNMFLSTLNESTTSSSLEKIYESVLIENIQGTIRVSFSLSTRLDDDATTWSLQGRIYRNGVAVGTLRSATMSSAPSHTPTYTEDIPGWKRTDRLQIYASVSAVAGSPNISLHTLTLHVDFV